MKRAVFVTGAANGTGLARAERFAKEGYDIFITSRDAARAPQAAAEIAARHNVFAMGFGTDPAKSLNFFTMPVEEFQEVLNTNLIWNFKIVRQASIHMRDQRRGAIVFFSSNTAYRAIPNRAAYSTFKGGINAMARALAIDLGPYGIRCNVVLSGTIKTDRRVKMGSKQIVNGKQMPIANISDLEDIASAAWYLGSDQSKNVTATEITVDGGMTCQLYP